MAGAKEEFGLLSGIGRGIYSIVGGSTGSYLSSQGSVSRSGISTDDSIKKLINTGKIYKDESGKIVFEAEAKNVDREYVKQNYGKSIKRRLSLDNLGIVLENVELKCHDRVKIIATKSSNITGEKLDIVLSE